MTRDEQEQLTKVVTLVEDMHHRLFGNGQPGYIKDNDKRVLALETDQNRVKGMISLVKFAAVLTPLIVGVAEWYRLWLAAQPVVVRYLP